MPDQSTCQAIRRALIGVPLGIIALEWTLLTTAAGLVLIFFAKERVNDERVQQLKMKAMFTVMSGGIGLAFTNMSGRELLVSILLAALGIFHYWRWQDGRADRTG